MDSSSIALQCHKAMAKEISKEHIISDIIPTFIKLSQDEQDSVRVLTVEDLISIAETLSLDEIKTYLLTPLRSMVSDKSWRVRYMIAENFVRVRLENRYCHQSDDFSVLAHVNSPIDNESSWRRNHP